MAEYIKREDIFPTLFNGEQNLYSRQLSPRALAEIEERIASIPSADVAEVRRGEWLPDVYAKDTRTGYEYLTLKCSVCGCGCMSRNNFCHRCGADMRKDGGQ